MMAQAGAAVTVLARTAEDVDKTASEIRDQGGNALAVPTDVRVSEQIANMVDKTLGKFGRIDILVNNAGTSFPIPTLQLSEGAWDALVRENLKTAFLCSKAVAETMIEQGGGSIVNISSTEGMRSAATNAAYAASKAGIINLTKSLAVEWAQHSIRVNCICPGFIWNPGMDQAMEEDARLKDKLDTVPMKRIGGQEEIGAGVIYLVSDASTYTTGAVLAIDGGFTSVLG